MKCLGCYKESRSGYCLSCRKLLFRQQKVEPVLDFDAPKGDNLGVYQELSKKLSISGVQLKYSVKLEGHQLILTEKKGEYILKPIPPSNQLLHQHEVPENEHLTMQMANQVFHIPTAPNALIKFKDGTTAYITRRFDIKENGEKYLQEDFAQLSNRTRKLNGETFKYDGNYEEMGLIIKKVIAASIPALENLYRLILFNYIFSNGDAHLKNFSIYRKEHEEYEMTPAYDLMSTVLHTPQESDIALDLYENDMQSDHYTQYGFYGLENFLELSKRFGLVEKRAKKIIEDFFIKKEQALAFIKNSFLTEEVQSVYIHNFLEKLNRIASANPHKSL